MSSPRRRPYSRAGAVLGAALAVTVAAGCGGAGHTGSSVASQTTAASATAASGASTTDTSTAPSVKTSGAQPTPTTATPSGAASTPGQPAPPSPGGQVLRRFAGYGNGRLGTLVVHARSVLVWNARHPGIQIFTSNGFMLVNSRSPTGAVRLSRGTYRRVRVSSAAHWSVELRSAPS
jgi:hypothetical protein